ncbi:MAG TPA: hypothetical protein GXX14_06205 [Clostridiaceae bacterium]|nr:hypothetical protein [Clostridiaceae bacterium]
MRGKPGRTKKYLTNKNNKKVVIIAACLVLLAVLAAVAYSFLSKKSPRQLYIDVERNNYKKYSEQIKKLYNDFVSSQKPYMESRHRSRLEITAEMDSESSEIFGIQNVYGIIDAINKSKLVTDVRTDPSANESFVQIELLLDKSPLFGLEAFIKDRQVGFTAPLFMPGTYFLVDMEKADDVYDRFNIPVRPKRFLRKVDIVKALQFDESKLDAIGEEYGNLVSDVIEDEDVKYGDTEAFKIGDVEIKVRELIVKLDSNKTRALFNSILEKAMDDELLLNLIFGNYNHLVELIDETGFFQAYDLLEDMGIMELNEFFKEILKAVSAKKDIGDLKSKIEEFLDGSRYPDGFEMRLIIDNSGNIVDRKIHVSCKTGRSDSVYAVDIHSANNSLKSGSFFDDRFIRIEFTETDGSGRKLAKIFEINTGTKPGLKDEEKGKTVDITVLNMDNGTEKNAIRANFDIHETTDRLTLKKTSVTKYDIKVSADDAKLVDIFNGEIYSEKSRNDKFKTVNTKTDIKINTRLTSFGLKDISFRFKLAGEDKFDIDPFELPDFRKGRVVDLNRATDDELAGVQRDLLASFGAFYLENKSLIDGIMGAR